jgi:hypothetical protein
MTYAHISTSAPQRSDLPEYGKWVIYCLHTDEAGESYTAFEYDNNKQRLAKKRIRS